MNIIALLQIIYDFIYIPWSTVVIWRLATYSCRYILSHLNILTSLLRYDRDVSCEPPLGEWNN